MKRLKQATMMLPLAAAVSTAYATDEQTWGIAAMYRTASIPFYTANDDSTVSTFVPMMFLKMNICTLTDSRAALFCLTKRILTGE